MEKNRKDFLEFDDIQIYILKSWWYLLSKESWKIRIFLKSPSVSIQICADQHKSNNAQILQTKQVVAAATDSVPESHPNSPS